MPLDDTLRSHPDVQLLSSDMTIDIERLRKAYDSARDLLLAECQSHDGGPAHWTGELSTSALSTATAVMALQQVRQAGRSAADFGLDADFDALISNGIAWLADHQNEDGGWGDTVKSISNISTTMLCHAVFHATQTTGEYPNAVGHAKRYIDEAGGVPAVVARYGKDRTFSVPILTHCALAGLVEWSEIKSLPFEMAVLPARFYSAVRLPVVSYALPALIAIGQVKHHFAPTWNPSRRLARDLAIQPSLKVLERVQPPNGGFLEAAPLTSFVTMSLAAKGLADHAVVKRAVSFLCDSVRSDGSWPIDTNLATWTTTLSINALKDDVPESNRDGLVEWLLDQQYQDVHPYTNAAPGGWAWTDLPGGVPDADDTPGAIMAVMNLTGQNKRDQPAKERERDAVRSAPRIGQPLENAVLWLLDLQNRDGGFPTFCRGWGTLPFDRSAPDITAHCLRALADWYRSSLAYVHWRSTRRPVGADSNVKDPVQKRVWSAIQRGVKYLAKNQRADGSWLPLWFGNQFGDDDANPVYGTSRVLMWFRDFETLDQPQPQRAGEWLASVQHDTGGWGGDAGIAPSVEETALASEVLLEFDQFRSNAIDGIEWLIGRVEDGSLSEPSPIGFYFARLWYFERLYPLIFTVSALRRAVEILGNGDQQEKD